MISSERNQRAGRGGREKLLVDWGALPSSVAKQKSDYQQHLIKKVKITKNQWELQENNCNRSKGANDRVMMS